MKNTLVTLDRAHNTKGDLERLTLNLLDSVINIVDEMRRYASANHISLREWTWNHSEGAYMVECYRHAFSLLDVVRATVTVWADDSIGDRINDYSTEGMLDSMLTYDEPLDFHCDIHTLGFNSNLTIWLEPRSNRQTEEE